MAEIFEKAGREEYDERSQRELNQEEREREIERVIMKNAS